MGILVFFVAVAAFFAGAIVQTYRMQRKAKHDECQFKHACTVYDPLQTHLALKRVIKLLVDSDVPKKEIRAVVNYTIKSA